MSEVGMQLVENERKRKTLSAEASVAYTRLLMAANPGKSCEKLAGLDLDAIRRHVAELENAKVAASELMHEYGQLQALAANG